MVKNRINEYRTKKGITQADLADQISGKPNKSLVSIIETGSALPTVDFLRDMCKALDCTPLDLYDADDINLTLPFKEEIQKDSSIRIRLSDEEREKFDEALATVGYGSFEEWFREVFRRLNIEYAVMKAYAPIFMEDSPLSPPCQ